ncbi:galactokinase [Bacillus sp. FJAT-42376]|uniref:galactokinase n=1 Tax=Bacillus sp. FJAT-42376 TaxID=2014076 RepID=UPI000F4E4E89|nr:galactokinase [Bacillus sp. FJAT-42376]AZB40970.1 galactokinase [Bacillus sp. FJAT-42376]
MLKKLLNQFNEVFGHGSEPRAFFAPGRVNLIGEHTDYNGGHVFPCALNVGTYCLVRERSDQLMRLYSLNFKEKGIMEFGMDDLQYREEHDWANYPKGVMKEFAIKGMKLIHGMDVLYFGNIPNGAGLSSSASIELASAVMFNELTRSSIDMIELVKMSQHAENDFIGVSCGIMDQFAIGMGKKDSAVLLNCQTLEYEYSPLELNDAVLVISNTGKRRTLADSKYNERRAECERALKQLKRKLDIQSLGDLSAEEFEQNQYAIENETDRKRARHAVMENIRTLEAVKRLREGDIAGFGQLMNESHKSLRDDYEVTGKELDAMAEIAWEQPGVTGSRMTGAGFGGCTVSIVQKDAVPSFISGAGAAYEKQTGLIPAFYVVEVGEGAREITSI